MKESPRRLTQQFEQGRKPTGEDPEIKRWEGDKNLDDETIKCNDAFKKIKKE